MLGLNTKKEIKNGDFLHTIKNKNIKQITIENIDNIVNDKVLVKDVNSGITYHQTVKLLFDTRKDAVRTLIYLMESGHYGPSIESTDNELTKKNIQEMYPNKGFQSS